MSEARKIIEHDEIKKWAEERDGVPAFVKDTASAGSGILRFDFDGREGSCRK